MMAAGSAQKDQSSVMVAAGSLFKQATLRGWLLDPNSRTHSVVMVASMLTHRNAVITAAGSLFQDSHSDDDGCWTPITEKHSVMIAAGCLFKHEPSVMMAAISLPTYGILWRWPIANTMM